MLTLPRSVATLLLLAAACSSDGGSPSGGGSGGAAGGGSTGGSGNGTSVGSCAHGANSCATGTQFCCADYHGSFTAAEVQSDCANVRVHGEYSADPCTTANLEASCTLYPGTAAEKVIRYYTGYDAASMSDPATNCSALHGTLEIAH